MLESKSNTAQERSARTLATAISAATVASVLSPVDVTDAIATDMRQAQQTPLPASGRLVLPELFFRQGAVSIYVEPVHRMRNKQSRGSGARRAQQAVGFRQAEVTPGTAGLPGQATLRHD